MTDEEKLAELDEKYKRAFVYLTGELEAVEAEHLDWLITKLREEWKENTRLRKALQHKCQHNQGFDVVPPENRMSYWKCLGCGAELEE